MKAGTESKRECARERTLELGERVSESVEGSQMASSGRNGTAMLALGFGALAVVFLWDWSGMGPSRGALSLLGLWLMLGSCVAMAEAIYT